MFAGALPLGTEVVLQVALTRAWDLVLTALVKLESTGLTADALEQQVAAHIAERQREERLPTLQQRKIHCSVYSQSTIILA